MSGGKVDMMEGKGKYYYHAILDEPLIARLLPAHLIHLSIISV